MKPKKGPKPVPLKLRQAAMSAAHEADSLMYDIPHIMAHATGVLKSPNATPQIKKDAKHVLKHARRIAKSAKGVSRNLKNVPEARSQYDWIGSARKMLKGKPKL